ncbi:MAG: filamentous hemagglutinin N-terminal domain-containing protein, partial [Geitlerinemataceae cyanobacterium]
MRFSDRSSYPSWTLALLPLTLSLTWVNPAVAQLIPDNTLGSERSVVTPLDTLNDQIDGGALRGSNLFHSFQDFNIDDDRGAFFSNPAGIENILTRITGGNSSNIFGTLGVLGDANLFLLNPNGIVFGPNARLDLGGSFFASTAEGINFLDGYQFSATNPDVPPLLTINVPIGLQFGANPGGIVNQSVATNDAGEVRGLEVPLGETLALVGGNVTLDGGSIQARGGRAELGGLAGVGTVGVNADGSLSFPEGVERADVSLANDAEVNVRAGGGGEISVRAGNFEMSGISKLRAGIADGMGVPESQAGDINIDTTGTVALFDETFISNAVLERAIGNGGDVNVTSQTLSLLGDAERFAQINT